jgi:hypothetical protein
MVLLGKTSCPVASQSPKTNAIRALQGLYQEVRGFNTFAKRWTGAAARKIRVPKKLRDDSVVVTRKGER